MILIQPHGPGTTFITNDGCRLQLLDNVLQRLHGRMLMGEPLLLMGQVVSSLKMRRGGLKIKKIKPIFFVVDPVGPLQKKRTL